MMDEKSKLVSPHGAFGASALAASTRKSGSADHMADAPRDAAAAAGKAARAKPQVRRTPNVTPGS
jgi:uncharacterized membrane protein